jgi:hypothetical protein
MERTAPFPGSRFSGAPGTQATMQAALWKWGALLAAGFCTNFTVETVGAFPIGEFVLAAALGVAVLGLVLDHAIAGALLRSRLLWIFVACQVVALLGYVVSDLYWGSTTTDMARGWARMIFLTIDIVAIAFLFDVPSYRPEIGFVMFLTGYGLGSAAATLMGNVLFDDYWKFGWGPSVTIFVILLAPRAGFWLAQAACIALGVVHLALDFRSMAAICLLTPAVVILQRFPLKGRVIAVVCAIFLGVAALGSSRLTRAASDPGDIRAVRSDVERTAMVQAAWEGFMRSPWLGNGSWFSKSDVMQQFFALRYQKSWEAGIGSFGEDDGDLGFAIHSQILVALAEGGVLGGVFFAVYGVMLLWTLGVLAFARDWNVWSNIIVFYLLLKFCDLCTSPFSGFHRVLIAVAAGLILLIKYRPTSVHVPETDRQPLFA